MNQLTFNSIHKQLSHERLTLAQAQTLMSVLLQHAYEVGAEEYGVQGTLGTIEPKCDHCGEFVVSDDGRLDKKLNHWRHLTAGEDGYYCCKKTGVDRVGSFSARVGGTDVVGPR